ncbi:MAG: DUF58 domain-containing protein [Isosphaeraceae bacterium]
MPAPAPPLFDTDFLKKLEYLSLVSKRVFRGQILAQRRTMQLGGGIEFADHREYAPGDDFRYLDWNVFARHDELLLKRFQEEEDLHVYVLVDCSRSMAVGDPLKFDYARRVAAALAYIALADLDRVAVVGFAEDIVADFPLTRGKARALSLMKFLEGLQTQGSLTDLRRVAQAFIHRRQGQRRGLAVVVSDLFDPNGFQGGLDLLRHHRYEPHVVQVFDRSEADPSFKGDVELLDVETGAVEKVTVTERNLRQYKQIFEDYLESVRRYCATYAISMNRTTTDVPFDELILRMMRQAGAVA